jgi:hypothetical protein
MGYHVLQRLRIVLYLLYRFNAALRAGQKNSKRALSDFRNDKAKNVDIMGQKERQ